MAVSDWDWFLPVGGKSLDPTLYISTPTSLKGSPSGGTSIRCCCLSRLAEAQNLPQGQLVSYYRRGSNPCGLGPAFRNQSALGSPTMSNGYHGYFSTTSLTVYRRVNDVDVQIGGISVSLPNAMWKRYRTTWWNGENLLGVPAICIRLEEDDGAGNWVLKGTLYDTANQWKDSEVNRVGLTWQGGGTQTVNYDDTEIWIPTV